MAGLSRKGGASRPKPHMNVTPLVDVVLVLLIIFMIVIPAMEEGLNLEVPQVENPDPDGNTDEDHPHRYDGQSIDVEKVEVHACRIFPLASREAPRPTHR